MGQAGYWAMAMAAFSVISYKVALTDPVRKIAGLHFVVPLPPTNIDSTALCDRHWYSFVNPTGLAEDVSDYRQHSNAAGQPSL